jgi:hypothetical protein
MCNRLLFVVVLVSISVTLFFTIFGKEPSDHYERLGIYKHASKADIKSAFRKASLKDHPDKNPGNAEAKERFLKLVEAKDTLLDDERRRIYDEELLRKRTETQLGPRDTEANGAGDTDIKSSWLFFENAYHTNTSDCSNTFCWYFIYIYQTLRNSLSVQGFFNGMFCLLAASIVTQFFLPVTLNLTGYALNRIRRFVCCINLTPKRSTVRNDDEHSTKLAMIRARQQEQMRASSLNRKKKHAH